MSAVRQFDDLVSRRGLSRVARELGVGEPFVCRLRHGERRPSLETAVKIETISNGTIAPRAWIDEGPE